MRMYSTSHSPRRSGWKPLLHMPQPAKCTMKAGLSTHGLSMSSHLSRPVAPQQPVQGRCLANLEAMLHPMQRNPFSMLCVLIGLPDLASFMDSC